MTTTTEPAQRSRVFRRFVIACLCVGLGVIAYFGVFAIIGYTDDAYIRSEVAKWGTIIREANIQTGR